jgi:hypothetical protein
MGSHETWRAYCAVTTGLRSYGLQAVSPFNLKKCMPSLYVLHHSVAMSKRIIAGSALTQQSLLLTQLAAHKTVDRAFRCNSA